MSKFQKIILLFLLVFFVNILYACNTNTKNTSNESPNVKEVVVENKESNKENDKQIDKKIVNEKDDIIKIGEVKNNIVNTNVTRIELVSCNIEKNNVLEIIDNEKYKKYNRNLSDEVIVLKFKIKNNYKVPLNILREVFWGQLEIYVDGNEKTWSNYKLYSINQRQFIDDIAKIRNDNEILLYCCIGCNQNERKKIEIDVFNLQKDNYGNCIKNKPVSTILVNL